MTSNYTIATDPTAAVTASTDVASFPVSKTLSGVASTTTAGGTGATFKVTTDANGKIDTVLIDTTGFGYTKGDTVTITAAQLAAADGEFGRHYCGNL